MNIIEKSGKVKSQTPITLTFFHSVTGTTAEKVTMSMAQLVERLCSTEAESKHDLPLISGCRFGDSKTGRGSLRHDGNVSGISAIVADYDAGKMSIEDASDRLAEKGVGALIYATARHTPDSPRWRVICPLADMQPCDRHKTLADRLDQALGGKVLANESWTVSQPYFFGFVSGKPKEWLAVEGDFLDQRPDLDGEGTEAPSVISTVNKSPEELKAFDPESLHSLLMQTGPHSMREPEWSSTLRAVKGAFVERPDLGFEAAEHVTAQWTDGVTSPEELAEKWDSQNPRRIGEAEVLRYCGEHGARPDDIGAYVGAAGLGRAQEAFSAEARPIDSPTSPPARKRFAGIHARDFTVHVEPAIVDGLLTDGAAAAMIGPTSIGKTNLLIHLLCCIAHGIPFFGRDTERRAVALVEMEGARAVQSRILAWHGHYGLDISEAPFLLIPDSFNLAPDTDTPELIAALKGFEAEINLPLGVVAIDTFHAASAGLNENDAGDVAVALRRLAQIRQETKAATLIVHHTGLSDTTRGRGSSALKASLDTELLVEKTDGGLLMRATKQRDLDIGKPFHFRLQGYEVGYDRDGQSIFAPVVIPSAPPSRGSGREIKGHTADTLRVLKECGNGATVRREVWFAAFEDQYAGSADAAGRRRLFNKAVATLKERGLIVVDGGAVRPAGEMSSSAAMLPGTSRWADLLDGTSPQ